MLNCYFLVKRIKTFFKNNLYVDYFFKKIASIFLKNFLVLGASYFSEKFMIEHYTKKIFNNYLFYTNKLYNFFNFCLSSSYYFIFISIFIFIAICELIYIYYS